MWDYFLHTSTWSSLCRILPFFCNWLFFCNFNCLSILMWLWKSTEIFFLLAHVHPHYPFSIGWLTWVSVEHSLWFTLCKIEAQDFRTWWCLDSKMLYKLCVDSGKKECLLYLLKKHILCLENLKLSQPRINKKRHKCLKLNMF